MPLNFRGIEMLSQAGVSGMVRGYADLPRNPRRLCQQGIE
jgi:hypothetical protein